jgi:cytosine/uracil/thiamine/allantoin permease
VLKKIKKIKKLKNIKKNYFLIFSVFIASNIYAQSYDQTAGDVFTRLSGSFYPIVDLMFAVCIVAGLAFGIAGITKFKQFKDNPQQISVGQPIGLLFLAAVIMWLPFIINTLGYTLTGATSREQLKVDRSNIDKPQSQSGFNKGLP